MKYLTLALVLISVLSACSPTTDNAEPAVDERNPMQQPGDLIDGEVMALSLIHI